MQVTQIWIATPVDYLKLPDELKGPVINTLLSDPSVTEVYHYSEFLVCCDVTSEDEYELIHEIKAIKSRIEMIFRSFRVWSAT